ncbi:acyl-CoA dehydrogenase family protein [Elusimicrobiota bacterium]
MSEGAAVPYELFTPGHEAFRKELREFFSAELIPHVDRWEEAGEFPRELFGKMGERGYLGLPYPQEYGGKEADFPTLIVLAEELARGNSAGVASAIFAHSVMSCLPLHLLGTEEQKRRFLVPAIKGGRIGALAITEPDAGSDASAIETSALKDGDGYVVNGSKMFITNGTHADFVVLTAKTDKTGGPLGISLFVVEKGTPGFSVKRKLEKMGHHTAGTAELAFEDVRVPKENLLGREGRGFHRVIRNFEAERLVISARNVASAQQVFEWTLDYAKRRKAFGKTIGSFQVIAHKLADMATEIEACRQLVYSTVAKFSAGKRCAKEIAMCKCHSGEMANRVCYAATQIFGGYGFLKEFPVERAFRDARAGTITGGTTEIMKEIIRRELRL